MFENPVISSALPNCTGVWADLFHVWEPCNFLRLPNLEWCRDCVWVPCNFIFCQTIKMLRAWHQPLLIVSTSLSSLATRRLRFEFSIWTLWVPFLRALQFFSLIWMACNFTFFQPKVAISERYCTSFEYHVIYSFPKHFRCGNLWFEYHAILSSSKPISVSQSKRM